MIRTLSAVAIAATFGLSMSACRPTETIEMGERQGGMARGEPVPDIYDWRFLRHDASDSLTIGVADTSHDASRSRAMGELNFGADDPVEGVSLFRLTCSPQSREVKVSWGYPGEVVLTSGTATGTFRANEQTASNHPVLTALRDNGVLAVGLSGADMTLKARAAGRSALAAFFDYCERGPARLVVQVPAPTEVAATVPATDDAALPVDGLLEEPVVEPAVPAAEGVPAT